MALQLIMADRFERACRGALPAKVLNFDPDARHHVHTFSDPDHTPPPGPRAA
jgi:hypothetical protein